MEIKQLNFFTSYLKFEESYQRIRIEHFKK
jgi:hypothetical protein